MKGNVILGAAVMALIAVALVAGAAAAQGSSGQAAERRLADMITYPGTTEGPVLMSLRSYDEIMKIYCRPKVMTSIKLPNGEIVREILTGDDTKLWQVGGDKTPFFCCKPAREATQTTALVRSSADHYYHFALYNLDNREEVFVGPGGKPERAAIEMPQVDAYKVVVIEIAADQLSWIGGTASAAEPVVPSAAAPAPQPLAAAVAAEQEAVQDAVMNQTEQFLSSYPLKVDTAYSIDNRDEKRYKVSSVYSDGTFTWILLKGPKALYVYEENEEGDREAVNYRILGDYYRVDRVCELLQLADGDKGKPIITIEHITKSKS